MTLLALEVGGTRLNSSPVVLSRMRVRPALAGDGGRGWGQGCGVTGGRSRLPASPQVGTPSRGHRGSPSPDAGTSPGSPAQQPCPAHLSPAQQSAARHSAAQSSAAQSGPAQPSPAQPSPVQPSQTQPSPAGKGRPHRWGTPPPSCQGTWSWAPTPGRSSTARSRRAQRRWAGGATPGDGVGGWGGVGVGGGTELGRSPGAGSGRPPATTHASRPASPPTVPAAIRLQHSLAQLNESRQRTAPRPQAQALGLGLWQQRRQRPPSPGDRPQGPPPALRCTSRPSPAAHTQRSLPEWG